MADQTLFRKLEARIAAARRALLGPAIVRAWGPPLLWIIGFVALWLFGLLGFAPAFVAAVAGLVFYAGVAGLLWVSSRRWRPPAEGEARDLIDESVEGRPFNTWTDRPVSAERDGYRLWEAHRERLARAAIETGRINVAARWRKADPFYLRFIAPAIAAIALIVAGPSALSRLQAGLAPDFGALFGAEALTVEAWVTPPIYTGDAPVVLTENELMTAPEGSVVTLRVIANGRPTIRLKPDDGRSAARKLKKGVDGAYEAKVPLGQSMTITVNWWGERARFPFAMKPDAAPTIAFVSAPKLGEGDNTEFDWKAADDYGVARVELVARLAEPDEAEAANLRRTAPVDLIGVEPQEEEGKFNQDLTRHPWAGLKVMVHLRAYDVAGRVGRSLEVPYDLPEKLFFQPLAQSAQEIRVTVLREYRPYAPPAEGDGYAADGQDAVADVEVSRLEQAPPGVKLAAQLLDAVTYRPETYFVDPAVFLGLRQARSMLGAAIEKPQADETDDILWATALRAEFGSLADARAALEAARRALENALRNGASEEELQRLMQAFRDAVENYLAAEMAAAIRDGRITQGDQRAGGDRQPLGDDALQRMLDTLQDLAETGATEQARQLLAEMDRMLDQLAGNMQLNIQPGGQGQQQDGPMSRALNRALRETNQALGDQRDLADQTEQAGREGESGQQGQQRGQELADQQRRLREQLERQRGQQGQQGQEGQPGEQGDQRAEGGPPGAEPNGTVGGEESPDARRRLGQAIDAQRRAEEALRRGEFDEARRAQQEAMDALAARSAELARQADSEDPNAEQAGGERDPLGRQMNSGDSGYGENIDIPDEMERQRARDILNEIRRRAANRQLSAEELEYLRRLLERF